MEKLSNDEGQIYEFHCHLQNVKSVDDIFPPDIGALAPLPPTYPELPSAEHVSLASVHDLCLMRQRRNAIIGRGDILIRNINELIDNPA